MITPDDAELVEIIESLSAEIHLNAKNKGFWDGNVDLNFILTKLFLVGSEVVEVLEAIRKQKGDLAVVEEMADIIIRLLDLYAGMVEYKYLSDDIELMEILLDKMYFNKQRPRLHGNLV